MYKALFLRMVDYSDFIYWVKSPDVLDKCEKETKKNILIYLNSCSLNNSFNNCINIGIFPIKIYEWLKINSKFVYIEEISIDI